MNELNNDCLGYYEDYTPTTADTTPAPHVSPVSPVCIDCPLCGGAMWDDGSPCGHCAPAPMTCLICSAPVIGVSPAGDNRYVVLPNGDSLLRRYATLLYCSDCIPDTLADISHCVDIMASSVDALIHRRLFPLDPSAQEAFDATDFEILQSYIARLREKIAALKG
jgi:hypothetical protein